MKFHADEFAKGASKELGAWATLTAVAGLALLCAFGISFLPKIKAWEVGLNFSIGDVRFILVFLFAASMTAAYWLERKRRIQAERATKQALANALATVTALFDPTPLYSTASRGAVRPSDLA